MQLYINSFGAYIHVKDEMFEIKIKTENDDVKLKHFAAIKISGIVMNRGAAISTDAIMLAMKHNVDVLFIDNWGNPIGRVWHSKLGSTTLIRKEQLKASIGKEGMKATKEWIATKICNEIDFLKDLKKYREQQKEYLDEKIEAIGKLKMSVEELEGECTDDIAATIRGLEGTSSRLFYEVLSELLAKQYQFDGRSSRPAKDQFNAFLNYAFGILYGRIEKCLILAGLDPYLGYLHRDDYNQKSFVYDFIEPFRIYAVEIVFRLFSGKRVNKMHTDEIKNGFSLNTEGKKLLVETYNSFMDNDAIRYKGRNQTRNNIILYEARHYANSLIKEQEVDTKDIDEIFEL